MNVEELRRRRAALLGDASLPGQQLVAPYTALLDEWLASLFAAAVGTGRSSVALVAMGGYGRAELCPGSDLDVMLVHRDDADIEAVAERLWYPIWDAGLHLGHAVRTPGEALALARTDLDTATALLDVRHLAGDEALSVSLATSAGVHWRRRGSAGVAALGDAVRARHAEAGEVAFLLEPDLKAGQGGLRDVHALAWLRALLPDLAVDDDAAIADAYRTLLAARVELHRCNDGRGDVLRLQDQDAVAAALRYADADALLAAVAGAARIITWHTGEVWERVDSRERAGRRGPRWAQRARRRVASGQPQDAGGALPPGVVIRDGRVHLAPDAPAPVSPLVVLALAVAAAQGGLRIGHETLKRCAAELTEVPDVWPVALRDAFVELLLAGPAAVPVVEDLDQSGLWVRLLPAWAPVRNRPQRNAYHRYTVDRHLVETAAAAAPLADRVERPDLLVLGALLHDLGKGGAGDHSERGAELATEVGRHLGLDAADRAQVAKLVRHHLLLPEVATRRDLSEPATVAQVASAVGDVATLHLLAALAEADGLATGPAAWSAWKRTLITELVGRVEGALEGAAPSAAAAPSFPSDAERALLAAREPTSVVDGATLTLVAPDRPGLFARVAGVLALHGLQVLEARASSDDAGWVLDRFRVEADASGVPGGRSLEERWGPALADLDRALAGRLALRARLAERARAYQPANRAVGDGSVRVVVDNEASERSTVIEVHALDGVGLLHRITSALADLDLDLRSARVATLGDRVVDVFYVRGLGGAKVLDAERLAEIERALLYAAEPLA